MKVREALYRDDDKFNSSDILEVDFGNKRQYEVVFIVDPTADDEVARLTDGFKQIVTDQGGSSLRPRPWASVNLPTRSFTRRKAHSC